MGLGKISVGAPYFNSMFVVPMLPLVLLMGAGMHATWMSMSGETLARRLVIPAVASVVLGLAITWLMYGGGSVLTDRRRHRRLLDHLDIALHADSALIKRDSNVPLARSQWGMYLAHLGVGMFVLGVTITSSYSIEMDRAAQPGDTVELAGYELVFRGMRDVNGVNYEAVEGEFELRRNGALVSVLTPQNRVYQVQRNPMTEADIDARWYRDVFLALGQPLGEGAWSLRIQYKPLLRFIWLGALVMAFGGLLAASDPRYRARRADDRVPAGASVETT